MVPEVYRGLVGPWSAVAPPPRKVSDWLSDGAYLVMLDVNVPALSGDMLVEGIRRQHATARIVLYSGSDATTLQGLAKAAGADGWIQKGTPMDEVIRKLRRLFSGPTTQSR